MRIRISAILLLLAVFCAITISQIRVSPSKRGSGNAFTRVDAPEVYTNRNALGKTAATASFNVIWTGTVPDSVKNCVNAAVDIWTHLLTTTQTVNIEIKYASLAATILADTRVDTFKNDFIGLAGQTQYPIALAKQLNGSITNSGPDMSMAINSNIPWYKGTDGMPQANKQDLITTVLHEIGHGLGIWGTMHVDGSGIGSFGKTGYKNSALAKYNDRYDYFGYSIGGKLIYRTNPSSLLGSYLTNGQVFFDGSNAVTAANGSMPKLYAPSTWDGGSSFAHLDEATYPAGNSNSLFTPEGKDAEVIWTPGEIGLAMLKDLGWNVNRIIVFKNPTAGQEITRGSTITIKWYDNTSNSETINLRLYKQPPGVNPVLISTIGSKQSVPGFNNTFTWNVASDLEAAYYYITAEGSAIYGGTTLFKVSNIIPKPAFSPAGGQHELLGGVTSLPIELSTSVEGGEIRYTLNSTEPNRSSSLYIVGQPIQISKTTTIKAKTYLTFAGGGTDSSATAEEKYFISSNSYELYVSCISGTVFKTSSGSSGESTNYLRLGIDKQSVTRRGFIKPSISTIQTIPQNAVIQSVEVVMTFSPYNIKNINVSFKDVAYSSNALTFFDSIGKASAFDTKPSNSSKFDLAGLAPKIQAIVNGTSNSLVIGMQSSDESNASNELSGSTSIGLRIYYRGNVEVSQVDKNNEPLDSIFVWQSNAWTNKGYSFTQFRYPWQPITLKGRQSVKPGTTEKWKVWSDKGADNFVNFNTFSLNSTGVNAYISKFDAADNTITIRNTIDGVNAGNVQFSDPWYIDYNDATYGKRNRGASAYPYTRTVGTTGFKPNGTTVYPEGKYNGVFLNQNPQFDPLKPIYTVNAPQPLGALSTFLGWSTTSGQADFSNANSPSTGVVFKQANTTVTAAYKGHLFSGSANATAGNNQRKVIKADYAGGKYCMVYESMDRIWLSTSIDGTNWSNEIEISNPTAFPGLNRYPSIENVSNSYTVHIVWQHQSSDTKIFNILYRTYNLNSELRGDIWPVYTENSGYPLGPVEAKPVIATKSNDHFMIAWKNPNDGIYVQQCNSDFYVYWSNPKRVPGTTIYCVNQSIASRYPFPTDLTYSLCWEDQNGEKIMYIEALYDEVIDDILFSDGYQVSPTGWYMNQRPSLVAGSNGTRPTVVWQSIDNVAEGVSVHFRRKFITGPSPRWDSVITSFSMGSGYQPRPIVGSFTYDAYPFPINVDEIIWTNNNNVYSAKYNSDGVYVDYWSGPSLLVSGINGGNDASILPSYFSDTNPGSILKIFKNSDNSIKTHASNSGGQQQQKIDNSQAKTLAYHLNKHILFNLESDSTLASNGYKGMIAFEIAGLGKQTAAFTEDLKVEKEDRRLKTGKFTVGTNNEAIKFAGAYYAKGLEIPKDAKLTELNTLVKLQLKDASTNEVVKNVWSVPFSRLAQATKTDGEYRTINIPLAGLKDREVYLDVTLADNFQPTFVDDYYMYEGEDLKMKKFFTEKAVLPTEYSLHQNFPNPFNPSTTIRFDLVEPQHVTLKIYNSLGQQVKELVDGYYDAGSHDVVLDASLLSSGAYFYRITAGKFSAVKSFMLVK